MAVSQLTVYHQLVHDPIFSELVQLIDGIYRQQPQAEALVENYHRLCAKLLETAEMYQGPVVGNAWQNHLLDLILKDDNIFSRKAEKVALEEIGISLREALAHDLRRLQLLFNLKSTELQQLIIERFSAAWPDKDFPLASEEWPGWDQVIPLHSTNNSYLFQAKLQIKKLLADAADWGLLVPKLAKYFATMGSGIVGSYWAFRWERQGSNGRLVGIPDPDPIRFSDLIGYEKQRQQVIDNTEKFLAGAPANNILLYGDRGTGKSSTVKALLHEYAHRGLRLVEVHKDHLQDYHQIIRLLKQRPQKFILFIDDLSFEEHETQYKELKAVLEGGLEPRPKNVLIYATSNRRHLVKEYFHDRNDNGESGEVRRQDTLQEKLSLADRFGLTVIFTTPTQKEYLDIVMGLAKQRGLEIEPNQLRRMALQWELTQNSRSCRTARQFIDQMVPGVLSDLR